MVVQHSDGFPQIETKPVTQVRGEIRVGLKKFPLRVLVIDDEPLVLWSIAEMLRSCGFEVQEADTAKAALHAFTAESGPPDVVLLDLKLPDSRDLGLLSIMRHLAPKTRVILMTAFGTPELTTEARRIGAYAVLDKPFDLNQLHGLLSTTVQ